MTEKKKLRIGIIGTGGIAGAHLPNYRKFPDLAEVVAGADIVPGKAKKFFDKNGMPDVHCYENHVEMLEKENLDAVSICTYNAQHAVCAIDALNRGVHVLLEKPMSVTLEEALAIREAELKSGKVLSIGFQPRFDPNMKMIKQIVESGELGQVYYIQTGGGRRRGIPGTGSFIKKETAGLGALGDIGCYSLDMVLNAIGYPKPLTVSAYTSNFFGTSPIERPASYEKFTVDDFAAAFIRLEGGIVLDFRIAWAMNVNTPGDTIILGTKAGLRIPSTDCWNGTVGGPMTIYKTIGKTNMEYQVPLLESKTDLFELKIKSFIMAVIKERPAPVPSSEIIINQAILDGIAKSAAQGKEIEVSMPEF